MNPFLQCKDDKQKNLSIYTGVCILPVKMQSMMKFLWGILAISLASCLSEEPRIAVGKEFVINNIEKYGLNGRVIEIQKTGGIEYVYEHTGTTRYAMEFIAVCEANESGYLYRSPDGLVRNLRVWDHIPSDDTTGALAIKPGSVINFTNNVILEKTDNGWKPLFISEGTR